MPDKPFNILLIQCDQLAAAFLPVYGNRVAVTPNLDRLAQRSAVFESAYCNFPLCAPSRFSMLSGHLASTIGAYDNGAEFPSSIPTFAHYLRSMGYQTCLVGKMHFVGADQLHGFEERLTTDIYPADFGWTGDWTQISMAQSNNDSTFNDAGICLRNVQIEYDEEVAHRAVRKVYDLARGGDPRPFMLTVSMTHPHDPYQCRQEHWDLYKHQDIDMPAVGMLEEQATDPYSKRLKDQYGLYDYEVSQEKVRVARHAYYGSISFLDRQVGRLLDVMDETGLSDNTAIVFTSDHGDMLGERGLWYKKCFFENAIRVPLLVHVPGATQRNISANVSLVDLLPTLLELADPEPESVESLLVDEPDGKSLLTLINDPDSDWDNTVYGESLAEGAGAAIVMVLRDRYKYCASGIDPEQLYDLSEDPHELVNLARDPAYDDLRNDMAALVEEKWDIDELSGMVTRSQQQRLFVAGVLKNGKKTAWDFSPVDQAESHCLRNDRTYNQWAYDNPLGPGKPGTAKKS